MLHEYINNDSSGILYLPTLVVEKNNGFTGWLNVECDSRTKRQIQMLFAPGRYCDIYCFLKFFISDISVY